MTGARPRSLAWGASLALAALAAAACAGSTPLRRAQAAASVGDLETARRLLEEERRLRPDSVDARIALGAVYYRLARDTLDRGGEEVRYLNYLERSVDEFVTAAELEPRHPDPHFYLAVMDVYRGDPESALRGLENTWRLRRAGIDCTNIGEVHVYLGDLEEARRWSLRGLKQGAGAGPVTFNRMLIDWRAGRLDSARRHFELLWSQYPQMLSSINAAPLPREPDSFEEFAGYCCASPACGPYLEEACRDLGLEVSVRKISEEAVLQELRIEMEKRRRLQRIYQGRKELEIQVEEPEPAP